MLGVVLSLRGQDTIKTYWAVQPQHLAEVALGHFLLDLGGLVAGLSGALVFCYIWSCFAATCKAVSNVRV
jgi:hypothetical protein